MSKKFRLLMVLVLVTGLLGGFSSVSADPVPGVRFQIPRIDLGDPFLTTPAGAWDTKIQIQNLGPATTVTATFYGPYVGTGVSPLLGTQAMWLPVKGVWTLHNVITLNFPTAESAIITTADPVNDLLAVTVDRWGTDAYGAFEISSSYTGIEDAMHGDNRYFAPYVMYNYNGELDTTLAIQNSGEYTVSVWIWYKEQGNCEYQCSQHIEVLAPGEAVRVGPGADADFPFPACVTPGWLGSAYISAAQPLGIIVDQLSHPPLSANRGTLTTFRGMPYKLDAAGGEWGTEWYADLLYREISGWDASIQVQNLTQHSMPTFVTVDFMDQSGDEIFFVGDWICRNGAETFYLPAITDLGINFPFGYVGAAEIASHQQVDYPGEHHDEGEPIFTVVDIKKRKTWDPATQEWRHTDAGEAQGGAYNAHPREEKEWMWEWYMPFVAKEGNGVTTRFALRNNANCNKFYGKIWIMDETGTDVGVIHTPWLMPKHLKIIDLAYQGFLYPGFVGSARFEVLGVEQLCDVDNDGHVDNEPIMPSIVVLNYGHVAELHDPDGPPVTNLGDLTRVYEAIPGGYKVKDCDGVIFGTVTVRQADHGFDFANLRDVQVWIDGEDTGVRSDTTGGYQVSPVDDGDRDVTFKKSGGLEGDFFDLLFEDFPVDCGDEELLDAELICANPLFVTVEDTAGNPIPGAIVTADVTFEVNGEGTETYMTGGDPDGVTDNAGKVTFNVAGAGDIDLEVTAVGHDPLLFGTPFEVPEHGTDDNHSCRATPKTGVELCKWNTIVGTVTIGGMPAEWYYLEAVDMSVDPPEVVDADYTTHMGVFSLENFSNAAATYRINLYNEHPDWGTFIGTTGDFDVSRCGGTATISYTSGTWGGLTPLVWVGGTTP